jgi:hypothetical protein
LASDVAAVVCAEDEEDDEDEDDEDEEDEEVFVLPL